MSDRIAVWFSCGAASAVAAKLTIERFPDAVVRVVNNPVLEEDDDNYRFLCEAEAWLGREIETAVNSNYPAASAVEVWSKRKFMSGPTGAPCTIELKKRARQEWEANNPVDWHVLGFTLDEMERHKRFILTERDNVIPVLIDARLTKQDCIDVIMRAGIKPPPRLFVGLPKRQLHRLRQGHIANILEPCASDAPSCVRQSCQTVAGDWRKAGSAQRRTGVS